MDDSTIVGIGGLLVGLITVLASLWWNYATRASQHREFLYNRQIEMYIELTATLRRLLGPCIDLTDDLTPQNRVEFDKRLDEAGQGVVEQFYKGLPILPVEVMDAIFRIPNALEKVDKLTDGNKIQNVLVKAELDVHDAIRECAGIDPLSDQMRRVFGER